MELNIDISEFENAAIRLGAFTDQVPFALSRALNDAAFSAREKLTTDTWPNNIVQRDRKFLTAALRLELSNKTNLTVSYYDVLHRGQLNRHADGGTKRPKSGHIAVPIDPIIKRGASGVKGRYKPSALTRSYRIGDKIFQRVGKGKNSRSRLMYVLKSSAQIKKAVPFREDFAETVLRVTRERFPVRLAEAMQTRRPR
jgi:hypothetical protein